MTMPDGMLQVKRVNPAGGPNGGVNVSVSHVRALSIVPADASDARECSERERGESRDCVAATPQNCEQYPAIKNYTGVCWLELDTLKLIMK